MSTIVTLDPPPTDHACAFATSSVARLCCRLVNGSALSRTTEPDTSNRLSCCADSTSGSDLSLAITSLTSSPAATAYTWQCSFNGTIGLADSACGALHADRREVIRDSPPVTGA